MKSIATSNCKSYNKKSIFYYSWLILLFLPIFTNAQKITIQGNVIDEKGKILVGASVQILNETTGRIIAFDIVNNKGEYELNIKKQDSLVLKASFLGFLVFTWNISLDSIKSLEVYNKNIVLPNKEYALNEFVVKSNSPIILKIDTVVFNTSFFTDGTEEIAEDVLKKLPGLDVSENGLIKVNGKQIETIMIEGDDLVGSQYAILSKNLSAKLIDKVEIIEKFQNKKLYKGIEKSEKVAINIRLNKNKNIAFFGNSELSFGTSGFNKINLNTFSILNKIKTYSFLTGNNIGEDDDDNNFLNTDQFVSSKIDGQFIGDSENLQKLLNLKFNSPSIKKNKYNFNKYKLANIHLLCSPSKDVKIKTSFSIMDNLLYLINRSTFQNLANNVGSFSENYNSKGSTKNFNGELSFIWDKKINESIEYKFSIGKKDNVIASEIQFNRQPLKEKLLNNFNNFDHAFNYTNKIDSSQLFSFSARYKSESLLQHYSVNTFLFGNLFSESYTGSGLIQDALQKLNFNAFECRYLKKSKRQNLDFKLILSESYRLLDSDLFLSLLGTNSIVKANNLFLNRFKYKMTDAYISNNFTHHLSDKISIFTKFELHHLWNVIQNSYDQDSIRKNKINYLNYKVGFNFFPAKKNSILLTYEFNTMTSAISNIQPGYLLTDYRTLSRGTGDLNFFRNSTLLLSYSYGSWLEGFFINANFIYLKPFNYFSDNTMITNLYSKVNYILINGGKQTYLYNLTMDQLIKKLSGNVKIKTSFRQSESVYKLNELFKNTKINSLSLGVEFRSLFQNGFNFHFGFDWSHYSYFSPFKIKNNNFNSFMDLNFSISKKIIFQIENDLQFLDNIYNQKNTYLFTNINFNAQIAKRISCKINLNNLFNVNTYNVFSANDIFASTTSYRLIPRYLMAKVSFGF